MLFTEYNPKELEPQIVEYWQAKKIVDKLRKRNSKGKKFYFLDGPPYTSGKFHLGHAWNYAIKDIALRYKRMHGFHVWDRNGFDVHGLPTEHKVMEKFNLKTKEDIAKFGVAKFVEECEKFCLEMAKIMTKDLVRMGITVDHSDPYMALKTEFMEGEWALMKKAYDDKRLYYGEKVLTWCQYCETAVAKHECEYKNVNEKSIFVKFPVKGKKNEFLIIWTTTPWTIPFNLAVMAGPEIEYVKVDASGEKWILAKALAGMVVQAVAGKKMTVLEEFKGEKLEGLEYVHPFEKYMPKYAELKKKHPKVHTIILSEQYVDTTAGSGLVHAAPGCGPEDQEACKPYDIPPYNNLTEEGFFPKEMGFFAGLRAKVDDAKFIEALQKEGVLIEITDVEHEYPHCWRCHNPVVFRITFQWFFKVEDLRDKILKGNKKVHWVPDTANNAYEAWIRNLKDNSVTRQRYWGTPIPIWKCSSCHKIKVIGSRREIEKNGGKVPKNIHKPWIDKVELKCSCGRKMQREPDVIDVWVDAGTASWNCLYNETAKIKQWYPADFIMEAKEQTKLWFSMLSICSYLYKSNNAFKNVYVYGMLNDIDGKKMSKSLGNIISPYELIDKYSVDVLRYYMCQNDAGEDINFSWDECKVKERQLNILWNVHKLLINLSKEASVNPVELDTKKIFPRMELEDQFIISKLHSTIKRVTGLMEEYRLDESIGPLEDLFLELSRTYIQIVRDRSAMGSSEEKEVCIYTIFTVLLELLKMFSVFAPFICEAIYLNFKEEFGSKSLKEESISHFSWPKFEEKKINSVLEKQVEIMSGVIQAALNAREKAKISLKWPVKEIILVSHSPEVVEAVEELRDVLKKQTNAKSISILDKLPGVKVIVKPEYSKIGPVYQKLSPQIITQLSIDSPETVLGHIEKEGSYNFSVDGKEVRITKEMLSIQLEVPKLFVEGEFKNGHVYVNTETSAELETEGYAREMGRHIQQMRKEAGLEKMDRIICFVKVGEEMRSRLLKFKEEIAEKIGAQKLEISYMDPVKKHRQQKEFKVKQEQFAVWFDKV